MEEVSLETRVAVLEKEMEWSRGDRESIKGDLVVLKVGQERLQKDLGDFRSHTDERISSLQAHTDAQFVEVHKEISGLHGEISGLHSAIATQTRWILAALLGAATMISLGLPIAMKVVDRLLP